MKIAFRTDASLQMGSGHVIRCLTLADALTGRHAKSAGRHGNSKTVNGFTLIEILVVMVIIGLLAGVAVPRLYVMSQRYEIAAQRQNLLTEIGNLGYRAYNSGQAIQLAALPGAPSASAPINLPTGWKVEAPKPIQYHFNGICAGGTITLVNPDGLREAIQLKPPQCQPTNPTETQ